MVVHVGSLLPGADGAAPNFRRLVERLPYERRVGPVPSQRNLVRPFGRNRLGTGPQRLDLSGGIQGRDAAAAVHLLREEELPVGLPGEPASGGGEAGREVVRRAAGA